MIAIAAGGNNSLALKSDGTVVAWGFDDFGESRVPAGLSGVTAIAAGSFHSLALIGPANTPPQVTVEGVSAGATYTSAPYRRRPAGSAIPRTETPPSRPRLVRLAVRWPATALGAQTASCSYTDTGGMSASAAASYTIVGTLKGFAPVDATPAGSAPVWNTVKGGSSVPLKFALFAGTTALTSTDVVDQPLRAAGVACDGKTADGIELQAAGGRPSATTRPAASSSSTGRRRRTPAPATRSPSPPKTAPR